MTRRVLLLLAAVVLVAGVAGLIGRSSSQAALVEPSAGVARYSLTVDGFEIASFSQLGGISSGYEPAELEVKSGRTPTLTVPGTRKPPKIVLTRGKTNDITLWAWHEQALLSGADAWKDAQLVMYDIEGKPVARYHLEQAWPAKVEIGALKAGASEVLMETVTIVCEHIQRVAP